MSKNLISPRLVTRPCTPMKSSIKDGDILQYDLKASRQLRKRTQLIFRLFLLRSVGRSKHFLGPRSIGRHLRGKRRPNFKIPLFKDTLLRPISLALLDHPVFISLFSHPKFNALFFLLSNQDVYWTVKGAKSCNVTTSKDRRTLSNGSNKDGGGYRKN